MAHLVPSTFTSYALTEEEILQGSLLTITQKQVLQNQLAMCAEEKLGLIFDPQAPELFLQEHAFKSGQIALIRWFLDMSESAEASLGAAPSNLDLS